MTKTKRTPTGRDSVSTEERRTLESVCDRVRDLALEMQALRALLDRKGDLGDILNRLGAVRALYEPLGTLDQELENLQKAWETRIDREYFELEHALREECNGRKWRLDGHWPTFYVERAITITIDEKRRTASVAGEKVGRPSAAAIATRLEPMVLGLVPRAFSPRAFISSVAKAYDALRTENRQVALLTIYKQLVLDQQKPRFWKNATNEAFIGMSIDQFRARLTRSLEDGVTASPDGREIRLLPPLDPDDAVFVYQPSEGRFGFIGRIEFVSP